MDIPLLENGPSIVDSVFLSSKSPIPPPDAKVANSEAHIVAVIDGIAAEFIKLAGEDIEDRPATDARMAEFLHRELKLTLHQASQHQFWHYVAVVKCPQYVAWRWFNASNNSVQKRQYIGPWYRNALGRLWWWAEYTQDPAAGKDRYARTLRAGQSQEFMRNTIENSLCGNRALVKSLCDAAFPAAGPKMIDDVHRKMIVRVNAMLGTTAIDALEPSEIDEVVKSVVKEIHLVAEAATAHVAPRRRGFLSRLAGRK
jgi:hypothetical protein